MTVMILVYMSYQRNNLSNAKRNVTLLRKYFETKYGINPTQVSHQGSVYIDTDCNSWRISDHLNSKKQSTNIDIIATINGQFIIIHAGRCLCLSTLKEVKSTVDGIMVTEGMFPRLKEYKNQLTDSKDKIANLNKQLEKMVPQEAYRKMQSAFDKNIRNLREEVNRLKEQLKNVM